MPAKPKTRSKQPTKVKPSLAKPSQAKPSQTSEMEFNNASSSSSSSSDKATTPVVPCLRKGSTGGSTTGNSGGRSEHVRFDEEIIAEHDKLRGTRQKIDEPKTPYHLHNVDAVDDEGGATASSAAASPKQLGGTDGKQRKSSVDFTSQPSHQMKWGDLESRLQVAKNEEDEEPKGNSEQQHEAGFEQHRKKHYNEFQKMQEFRARQAAGMDEEDE